ncbi:DUF4417 domain-containing protein [Eubacterium ruminantium]|uniref:DUF4417 domain-containing protein n=1 Tax=Eubacterium ruminantium TaxID=42322 RepID=A0A1T4MAP7_9FIRM|nr:DUF4417 domain-containing protein [Eubacterium ruminantium]SCW46774.1 protein of unknown function [Eubacterium ruminantium]SDM53405.1 protein of unknown function [Eubacterium ruminantium]SJZ64089.1 protein of unknown function [Eubacterium ruminantium]
MKRYEYHTNEYGERVAVPKDLQKLLNLQYLRYTNKTHSVGRHDLPEIICNTKVYPDYIALYPNKAEYRKTPFTAVAFYNYDDVFDGKDGLYNAIYYNDEKRLEWFKERFRGVRFFISPDYSELGDVDDIENNYRIKKARVVSLWLAIEMNAIVIPNITYPTVNSLWFYLDGLEKCTVVAFSTKGFIDNLVEREYLIEAVKYTVDHLHLEAIIVYDVCKDDKEALKIFNYAIEKGIKVIIPDNSLKQRNSSRKRGDR